jgi:hypothetical protein
MIPRSLLLLLPLAIPANGILCQASPTDPESQTGWEITGLPALNYDSDEGFGYGVVLSLYNYGQGGYSPYRFTLQPLVFLTTEGRRDLTLFFDAPHWLPGRVRVDAFLGSEKQVATPYYGLGNGTPFLPELARDENPYFYRFGKEAMSFRVNLQIPVRESPIRLLLGAGASDVTVDTTPKDEGTTLLAEELGPEGSAPGGLQSSLLRDLHLGSGGGVRVGLGPNFVVAFDFAGSGEAGLQSYIGLGFLF